MSININQIHIQTEQIETVTDFLTTWLFDTYGVQPITHSTKDSFFSLFEKEQPSLFVVSKIHEGWITVLHNSYEPPFELASKLSYACKSTVIQAMGQSTVDTYYLSVHQDVK
jgi:hypothetical protein